MPKKPTKYEIAKIEAKSIDIKHAAWMSLSEETKNAYQSDYDIFFKFIKKNIKEITASDIMKFIEHMEKNNFKNSTINRKIASLSKMFKVMKIAGEINENPVEILKQFRKINRKTSKEVKISLTIEDIRTTTKITKKSSSGDKKMSILVRMLAQSGLRISEMIHIKRNDIIRFDDKNHLIKILGKGKKERSIFISNKFLEEIFSVYPEKSDFPYLFYTLRGSTYDRRTLYNQIREFFWRKIKKKCHPHLLRHFYATYKINTQKMDIKAVSLYLGHSSISTTLSAYVDTSLDINNAKIKI